MPQSQFSQLKLVGKISLWFSLLAAVGLLVIVWLAGSRVDDYLGTMQNLAATRRNLPLVMLFGGLLLVIGTGITTWLITLYSSFRVAGPLYRFSKNLQAGVLKGEVPRVPIRDTDKLQAESQLLQESVSVLYQHYDSLDRAAEQLLDAVDRNTGHGAEIKSPESIAEIERAITCLQYREKLARYD